MPTSDETTPLLWDANALDDPHKQFCVLAGVPPSNAKDKHPYIGPKTLYGRATRRYASARRSHNFMSALNNILLLSQVILGATLTALGASESSHILITLFGVMNTVIAGLVAYLKSRGQPARTRLFRDDLERVVDEIENSEIMWLGIAQGIHGYDDIDIDDKVTVRSEVARLMRLYEKATRSFMMSNPDNYLMGQSDANGMALRSRAGIGGGFPPAPVTLPAVPSSMPAATPGPSAPPAATPAPTPAPTQPAEDNPDESPASAPPKPATPPPEDAKGKEPETTQPDTAESSKEPSKPASEDSKDKPPSYKDTPSESKDTTPSAPAAPATPSPAAPPVASPPPAPAPTPSPAPAPQEPPATAPAPDEDPDESPATSASAYKKKKNKSEDHGSKSS